MYILIMQYPINKYKIFFSNWWNKPLKILRKLIKDFNKKWNNIIEWQKEKIIRILES